MMAQNVRLDEFYHIIFKKLYFGKKNGRSACKRILDDVGGVTPLRADHLFLPQNAIFF